MAEEPQHHLWRRMSGQIVPDQEHAQRRKLLRQCDWLRQPHLPDQPIRPIGRTDLLVSSFRQHRQHRPQFVLEPGMEYRVGRARHPFDPHLPIGGMEQGQHLCRSIALILVRLAHRLALRCPTLPGIGHCLKGTSFILAPNCQSAAFSLCIRSLDQFFFASASGSMTVTMPCLRLRCAVPVSHQLRLRCHDQPASIRTARMVPVLTLGSPSGAQRRA